MYHVSYIVWYYRMSYSLDSSLSLFADLTILCFRYLLTCGSDGEVRQFEGFEDDDPVTHQLSDALYAIACKVCNHVLDVEKLAQFREMGLLSISFQHAATNP